MALRATIGQYASSYTKGIKFHEAESAVTSPPGIATHGTRPSFVRLDV